MIFADGLITPKLFQILGIENFCVLHGDFFHLYREDWPKNEGFGSICYDLIKNHLRKMLLSSTEDQWDQAYFGARKLISTEPTKVEKLDAIYKNPEYYSGYFLRKIPCNMKLRGSTPAEQNHASIIAMIGPVAS